MWSGSETELIMLLGVKDTLLETDTSTAPRLACATFENVSISLALAYFKTKHVVIKETKCIYKMHGVELHQYWQLKM